MAPINSKKLCFFRYMIKKNRQNVTLKRLITNEILSCFHSRCISKFYTLLRKNKNQMIEFIMKSVYFKSMWNDLTH